MIRLGPQGPQPASQPASRPDPAALAAALRGPQKPQGMRAQSPFPGPPLPVSPMGGYPVPRPFEGVSPMVPDYKTGNMPPSGAPVGRSGGKGGAAPAPFTSRTAMYDRR